MLALARAHGGAYKFMGDPGAIQERETSGTRGIFGVPGEGSGGGCGTGRFPHNKRRGG